MDVLCIGDATVDAFLTIHDADLYCRLNENDCELCIKYGEKIPVDKHELLLGGIASNVSVGLSRLGIKAGICAEIGDDELSQKIIKDLDRENVDRTFLFQTKGQPTSFAVGLNFKGERTLFVCHTKREHDFSLDNIKVQWLYLGGLGQKWEEPYKKTLDYAQKNNLRLAFTPGSSQLEELTQTLFAVLKKTEILFVNKGEAIKIAGGDFDVKTLLVRLRELGPKRVVITDGENGSYAVDEKGSYRLGVFPAEVVERTGAGDAYVSGFLAATILEKPIVEAMRFGAINAASVIEHVGAQTGLLTKEEIEKRMTNF